MQQFSQEGPHGQVGFIVSGNLEGEILWRCQQERGTPRGHCPGPVPAWFLLSEPEGKEAAEGIHQMESEGKSQKLSKVYRRQAGIKPQTHHEYLSPGKPPEPPRFQ